MYTHFWEKSKIKCTQKCEKKAKRIPPFAPAKQLPLCSSFTFTPPRRRWPQLTSQLSSLCTTPSWGKSHPTVAWLGWFFGSTFFGFGSSVEKATGRWVLFTLPCLWLTMQLVRSRIADFGQHCAGKSGNLMSARCSM